MTAPGEHLADYVIVYADGSEARVPVRRRFEVNQVNVRSQSGFVSRQHLDLAALEMRGPYPENMWGRFQTGVTVGPLAPIPSPPRSAMPTMMPSIASWSVYAMPNPHPDKPIRSVRMEPTGAAAIGIGGLTLFSGEGHPLRQGRLESYDVELGDGDCRSSRRSVGRNRTWCDCPQLLCREVRSTVVAGKSGSRMGRIQSE